MMTHSQNFKYFWPVYCVKSPFTSFVIPGLTRNPVFLGWIPAGVYPVLDTGRE